MKTRDLFMRGVVALLACGLGLLASPGFSAAATRIGAYENGTWYRDANGNGTWDGVAGGDLLVAAFGTSSMLPVSGDWGGNGSCRIGAFENGMWFIDANGNGSWDGVAGGDQSFFFGTGAMTPLSGDWNGDGRAEIGAFENGQWYLDANGNGSWDGTGPGGDLLFTFGTGAMKPVTGDWDGDGSTEIGAFENGMWYLDLNGNGAWDGTGGGDRLITSFGTASMTPVVGDWNGDGAEEIGASENGVWYLDANNSGTWNGVPGGDQFIAAFGTGSMRVGSCTFRAQTSPAALNGTFRYVFQGAGFNVYGDPVPASIFFEAEAGSLTFDGQGGCAIDSAGTLYEARQGQSGFPEIFSVGLGGQIDCTYTLSPSGLCTLTIDTLDGPEVDYLQMSADGSLLMRGGPEQFVYDGGREEFGTSQAIAAKQPTAATLASVAGDYYLVSQRLTLWMDQATQQNPNPIPAGNMEGMTILASFDGNGSCSVSFDGLLFTERTNFVNQSLVETVETEPLGPGSALGCTYTVAPSGATTLTMTFPDGNDTFVMYPNVDGTLVVSGGAFVEPDINGNDYVAEQFVGVKLGTAMTAADLSGTYRVISMDGELWNAGPGVVFEGVYNDQTTLTFDGQGGCTAAFAGSSFSTNAGYETAVFSQSDSGSALSCGYVVEPDGRFTLTVEMVPGIFENWNGYASASGQALVSGEANSDTEGWWVNQVFGFKID